VTSQNSFQPLVSKKCDLADSIASDLTSIESFFACIAKVVEGLTAELDRRSGLLPPDSAPNTTSIPGFAVCRRIIFGILGNVAGDKCAILVPNVDLQCLSTHRTEQLQKTPEDLRLGVQAIFI